MSVSSVRSAVTTALKDKKVTLAEAEKITHTAGRSSGISAAEKKVIAKALQTGGARFSPGAKAHLAAAAAGAPAPSTPVDLALKQIVNAKGIDAVSNLKDADEDRFSPELKAGLEKFAEILGNNDGDTLASTARVLQAGGEKLYVVNDMDYDKNRELVGFFDKTGKEVGRASIVEKDDGMKMNWEDLSRNRRGAPIGTPSAHAKETVPASFKSQLEAWVNEKNGDDLGKRIEAEDMPPEVRRHYEFLVRNASDSTGAERFTFQGKTIYALHDYACVSSAHFYTKDGKKLLSVTE